MAQDKLDKVQQKRRREIDADLKENGQHTHVQGRLARLGRCLGYDVWIARNDHARLFDGYPLGQASLSALPDLGLSDEVRKTVELIDVLWLYLGKGRIASAFEVEKSTSIYSGILRLTDMALSIPGREDHLYLIAPKCRKKQILAQLRRPMFQRHDEFTLSYLLFEDLEAHFDSLCRLGSDHTILNGLACRCETD